MTEASRVVLEETGLLPHVNAGVLTSDEFSALKTVSGGFLQAQIPPTNQSSKFLEAHVEFLTLLYHIDLAYFGPKSGHF